MEIVAAGFSEWTAGCSIYRRGGILGPSTVLLNIIDLSSAPLPLVGALGGDMSMRLALSHRSTISSAHDVSYVASCDCLACKQNVRKMSTH
jgi:hypothetical protein